MSQPRALPSSGLDPLLSTLALARVPGLGPRAWLRLHEAFGEPAAVLTTSRTNLRAIGLPRPIVEGILAPNWPAAKADAAWLHGGSARHLLTLGAPGYPPLLGEIPDPPPLLFVCGARAMLDRPQIAIVGSRHANAAGCELAYELARALTAAGWTVTSGLALGIDAAAHRGALDAGGTTHAVIATGPDRVYPARHRALREAIIASDNGTVLGENPPGVGPRAGLFPRRNRLVSGLSHGVVVIQAGRQSGALITARCAAEQGREVFAVPGSIHDPLARGCHSLLREGAKLVESVHDILEELPTAHDIRYAEATPGGDNNTIPSPPPSATIEDPRQVHVLNALGYDPVAMDTILKRTGLTLDQVSAILLAMELKGMVTAVPGGRYQRRGPEV
ncbi:DNA-protecting protein DprA [Halorhodospira abdelmalekii]|uniref:DNA-processing protein DprA n=1 Tax=Halorhodospira abdelmalekii TaxID=421629 RepID=UPI00190445A6|nr:DNA-processing protein DprA [Halorhodospira abdelmalekii]MBK1734393.1 DNA-protecting protein DprA [Halorhodospira abdelmalekii]